MCPNARWLAPSFFFVLPLQSCANGSKEHLEVRVNHWSSSSNIHGRVWSVGWLHLLLFLLPLFAQVTFRWLMHAPCHVTRLGIPILGSNFWDPHWRRNSDSDDYSKDSGWIFFLKFWFLESQKIGIPIRDFWNSRNFLHRNSVHLFIANLYWLQASTMI